MLQLRSKLRQALLGYYFTNPKAEHHLREIARIIGADPANLSRELAGLTAQSLFLARTSGRQKYFRLNRNYPLYEEFKRIVFKTVGVISRLQKTLVDLPGVGEAYLYGSFAQEQQDEASDIDILIVGQLNDEDLENAINKLERQFRREINYTVMIPAEFEARRRRNDPFLGDVLRRKTINLLSA